MKVISDNDEIKWSYNGRKLDKGAKYSFENKGNKSKLVIKNIVLEDEGTYAVEINNSRSSASLTVNGI